MQAGEAAGPPGMIVAGSSESRNYPGAIGGPAASPAAGTNVSMPLISRVHANRVIITGAIGGPAASPAAGTNDSMRLISRVHANRVSITGAIGGPAASPAAGTNITWTSIEDARQN